MLYFELILWDSSGAYGILARLSLSSESVFNCDEQCVLPLTYVISNQYL